MLETNGIPELCNTLVSKSYVSQGMQELSSTSKRVKDFLSRRVMPEEGWPEAVIERLMSDLALMDSNNFHANGGVGEREGRVVSPLVRRRNYGLAHGIGRSGDISAEQPKAAGSSLLTRICHFLVEDAMRLAGFKEVGLVQVFPLATGMAMMSAFLACASSQGSTARNVVWSRVDQKTCLKSITAANLTPVVIELRREEGGDEVRTDVAAIAETVKRLGSEAVACVVTTTSCFAPRGCDDVEGVARLCAAAGVPHVINNAYGLQSAAICSALGRACRVGRVDAIVQSTDKNFLVPVGGTVVAAAAGRPNIVAAMARSYPGRAAVTAHLDVLLTLLHLGRRGWLAALTEREALFAYLNEEMQKVAGTLGERVLVSSSNPISVAITVDGLNRRGEGVGESVPGGQQQRRSLTLLGAMLWQRSVSGVRVVARGADAAVAGVAFHGYGSSCSDYPHHYLTAAAAIGACRGDVDLFVAKLKRCYEQCRDQ